MSITATGADAQFDALHRDEWAWRVAQLGGEALIENAPVDDFLPDVDEPAQQQRRQRWAEVAQALAALPAAQLSPRAQVDHAVYTEQIDTLLAQQRFAGHQRPVNSDTSFWGGLADRSRRRLDTAEQARRYLCQLADVPRWFAQHTENMRAGLARGFAPPAVTMRGREATIRSVLDAGAVEDVCFFAPLAHLPDRVAERDELREQGRTLLREVVLPAHRELYEFVTREYLPGLPTTTAAVDGPDGEAFYQAQLREFTTTDLSPAEVFAIGEQEVAAIGAEMAQVAADAGFAGDVPGMLAFMRTDPQFYVDTPDRLLREAAWQAKKFDARVHRWFGRTPRGRFGIEEPPADLAPFYTPGRGGVDRYILNTYNLAARPLYALPALTLHEAAPGHAFQIPFAAELTGLPDFRRHVYLSAYGEGWALYCERLGVEMGMYDTPFELMGMLSYQMWRAVRLVVDPGMHALGWSRERGQDYLREHTALSEHEVVTEIDRYLSWPGQAAAYHLGQLKVVELRRRAESALGANFSIRSFHDAVLATGSVPLGVLERQIDRFIADGGRSPFAEDGT